MKPVKTVLVSHPPPPDANSPYHVLAQEYDLEIDFRNFVQVKGVSVSEFRKQNIQPLDYTAIVLTSKSAIDHFFRICKGLRLEPPPDMKYFCHSEATAMYLQKYITLRKRKLYTANGRMSKLASLIKKHADEKFLMPGSDVLRPEFRKLSEEGADFTAAAVYQTAPSDLSDLANITYDMLCFYSPTSIEALYANFPGFKQNETLIAVYGNQTAKAVEDAGLEINIRAPQPETPSMTMAIEKYLNER